MLVPVPWPPTWPADRELGLTGPCAAITSRVGGCFDGEPPFAAVDAVNRNVTISGNLIQGHLVRALLKPLCCSTSALTEIKGLARWLPGQSASA